MEYENKSDTNISVEFATDFYNETYSVTSNPENVSNSSIASDYNETQFSTVFEAFIISEIVMTATELLLSSVAALKINRWRSNYRNQMLMQLSLARFLKRIIFLIEFEKAHLVASSVSGKTLLTSFQMYIDFVLVILVCFFIKHMYDSVIIVVVKISRFNLYSVLCCSWLLPVPISLIWTAVIVTNLLNERVAYLIICLVFRWPLIFLGTALYFTVLYNVLIDKIRRFASNLTIITFLLCLVINFYLFSKDIIKLWCFESFSTILVSYVSGLISNFLILCFYITLITMNFRSSAKSSYTPPNLSTANVI